MNGLARRESGTAGDARLQVDHPDIRREVIQYPQGIPPGPGKARLPRDPAIGPLRHADVFSRVINVCLPQFRVARMRENLVDATTSHHIATQEQVQQPIAHVIHSAR